ncbi:(2Fe-2S)-binding protein [bacterium]|nr:(2Fe-2S)-binding protein [bacterium]
MKLKININGVETEVSASGERRLLDVLREDLKLTGTKEGCGEGECGACTIIINGEAVNSCLIPFGQLKEGDEILTIEGLAEGDKLVPLQESFIKNGAVHCGACTPGFIMSATALLNKNPKPTDDEIKDALAGNLCRCTGYEKIMRAVKDVIK